MRVAIDASNLGAGGGGTHLRELLSAANPQAHGIDRVLLWSSDRTLAGIEDRPWLEKHTSPVLNGHFIRRALWQRFALNRLVQAAGADVVFVPGGSILTRLRPVVTMHRNMLPFDARERRRYGGSWSALKLGLLRRVQTASLRGADGVIFLTEHAREALLPVVGPIEKAVVIPHGLNPRLRLAPRPPRPASSASMADPLRILYVSRVDLYKHQWTVAEAVAALRSEGLPVRLDLVGSAQGKALQRLQATLARVDPRGDFISCLGEKEPTELTAHYHSAEIFVFASSCETFPNILLESMASGLPIACSDREPMPGILADAGTYFDPEDAASIAAAIRRLVLDPALRSTMAEAAHRKSLAYSWERCADETMRFLSALGRGAGMGPAR